MNEVSTPADTPAPSSRPGHGSRSGSRPGLPHSWVSSSVRRMEPWLLGAMGVSLTALAVYLQADLQAAGTVALLPLLAAAWAQARPARRQRELGGRAFAVTAAALFLPLQAAVGAVSVDALWLAWLAIAVVAYGVVLRPAWSLGLAAFALLQAAPVVMLAEAAVVPGGPMTALLALPLVAAAVAAGRWLRRLHARREAHCFDSATGLCSLAGLLAYGEELLAARSPAVATLVVFDCRDLLEVRQIYGSRVARILLQRLSGKLAEIAGERGLAARTGPVEFAVLLPGAGRERALQALQQVLGAPSRIEFEAGDSEIMLVPDFLLGRLGEEEDDLRALHRTLGRKLAWGREQEERRRRYLRRERERHSRPMPLQDDPPAAPPSGNPRRPVLQDRSFAQTELPPTVPMPLPLNVAAR
ncbi:GGDEF domain-containing protein [Ramlibacter tataouinensis]|uniref:GGDEF domain-containing protein n=1 Tax=Ramlibacter tataouinensis TaxID=94132 RepID=UPI0022F3812B|nr:GGDEF domain-containing protein [Ramlibacter tataouinensis]WBY01851.1 GGDEF domain-containing protein [Ramlibacter tataouinensis]